MTTRFLNKSALSVSILLALNVVVLQYLSQLEFIHQTSPKPTHLIVIQHGLNYPSIANYPTYYYLKQAISEHAHSSDEYMIYIAHSNSNPYFFSFLFHTNNGIVHASTNLANEIYHVVTSRPNGTIKKISLIGSSIGGNYIQYASYLLLHNQAYRIQQKPFFEAIKPMVMISLAAPHFGIADWMKPLLSQSVINFLIRYRPSRTLNEVLHLDEHQIVQNMNLHRPSVFNVYDKVFIVFNAGWDAIVSCRSSSLDVDGTICEHQTRKYCNGNIPTIFDPTRLIRNGTVHRLPICLNRNTMETLMAHTKLALALPPIPHNIIKLLTQH